MNAKAIALVIGWVAVVGCLGAPATESDQAGTKIGERDLVVPVSQGSIPWGANTQNVTGYFSMSDQGHMIQLYANPLVFTPYQTANGGDPRLGGQQQFQGSRGGSGYPVYGTLKLKIDNPGFWDSIWSNTGLLMLWRYQNDRIWRPFRCGDIKPGNNNELPGNWRNQNANYFKSSVRIDFNIEGGMVTHEQGRSSFAQCGIGMDSPTQVRSGAAVEFGAFAFMRGNPGPMDGEWDFGLKAECEGTGLRNKVCPGAVAYATRPGDECIAVEGSACGPNYRGGNLQTGQFGGNQMGNRQQQQQQQWGQCNWTNPDCNNPQSPCIGQYYGGQLICPAGQQRNQQQQQLPQGCYRDNWGNPDCNNTNCRTTQYCGGRQQGGWINGEECVCYDEYDNEYACEADGSCYQQSASTDEDSCYDEEGYWICD